MTIGIAFTRQISPRLVTECELTHLPRDPIDLPGAIAQHAAYEAALAAAGLEIVRLPPLDDFPDATFVEDAAVILGEHAVILNPGVASRQGETDSVAAGLAADLVVHRLGSGHVDGGDVFRIGKHLYVGLSTRTDRAGVRALADIARPLGYKVAPVRVTGCLHLKTAITYAGPDGTGTPVFLHNPEFVSPASFEGAEPMAVVAGESYAANILRVGDTLIAPADSPRTAEALAARGFNVVALDISEFRKAEAALTCMSLVATAD
jgi:dimethylargininase